MLEHFSHPHPLKLLHKQIKDDGEQVSCNACRLQISGFRYNCTHRHYEFSLHKACAELPNKIIHFMHPIHPLTLLAKAPLRCIPESCNYCREGIQGFCYQCSLCQFQLDINCAAIEQVVEHKGHEHRRHHHSEHEHEFQHHRRSTSFTCDACGETEDDCVSYSCTTCQVWVHKRCASLPPTIKKSEHSHTLSLTYSVEFDESMEVSCEICEDGVDTRYWVYYCSCCTYVVHVSCAKNNDEDEDEDEDDYERKVGEISHGVKKMSHADDEEEESNHHESTRKHKSDRHSTHNHTSKHSNSGKCLVEEVYEDYDSGKCLVEDVADDY